MGQNGQLGNGNVSLSDVCTPWTPDECSTVPRLVAGSLRFKSVDAAQLAVCATTVDGAGYCWGSHWSSEAIAGAGTYQPVWQLSSTLTEVPGGLRLQQISAGPTTHSCGITQAGEAVCWGDNVAGQLGDGTKTNRFTPVKVIGQ
jgi:alpha-tubulin suppressor-like RCC1 family protein